MNWQTLITGLSVGAALTLIGTSVLGNWSQSPLSKVPEKVSLGAARACNPVPGGSTTIDSDNSGANNSSALDVGTTYALQCDHDAYFAMGPASVAADSGDIWLAAGAITKWLALDGSNYFSVLNKSDPTADCHYFECR